MKSSVAPPRTALVIPSDAPRSSEIGQMTAQAPRISRKLQILLPTTLPIEMPGEPASAASTLTNSSGVVVP